MNPNIPANLIGRFPQETLDLLYAPPKDVTAALLEGKPVCSMVVTTADGRTFDLGMQGTFKWHVRRLVMLVKLGRLLKAFREDLSKFVFKKIANALRAKGVIRYG